jgi:hypothetical protein
MKAFITLEYNGERLTIERSSREGETPEQFKEGTEFIWTDGNQACDCNRSLLARNAGMNWPDLDCSSEQIELVEMRFEDAP